MLSHMSKGSKWGSGHLSKQSGA
jgi:hypothetical protein